MNDQDSQESGRAEKALMKLMEETPCSLWPIDFLLEALPQVFLDLPFTSRHIPVRAKNVAERMGLGTWRQVLETPRAKFMEEPGFGASSYTAVLEAVAPVLVSLLNDIRSEGGPLLERIERWLDEDEDQETRKCRVLRIRLGLDRQFNEIPTLEEMGTSWGITRERIRQLEAKGWKELVESHPSLREAAKLLTILVKDRRAIMPINHLRSHAIFGTLTQRPSTFKALISIGLAPDLTMWRADGEFYLTALTDLQMSEILREIREEQSTSAKDIDLHSWCAHHSKALGVEAEWIASYLTVALSLDVDAPTIRSRKGNRWKARVKEILESSSSPLHYKEIAKLVEPDGDADSMRIQNVLSDTDGVMLLGHGLYGTRSHFPEIDSVADGVVQAAIEYMTSGSFDLERDWAMHALVDAVRDLADPPCGIDEYRLHAICCTRPDLFLDMGRLTVRLNMGRPEGPHPTEGVTRRQRHELAISVLEETGGPMETSALEDRVRKLRDLKDMRHILMQYPESLVLLDGERVGLVPRDLPGDGTSRSQVTDFVAGLLSDRGWSIALETASVLSAVAAAIPDIGPCSLRAVLLQDNRFLVDPGGTRIALRCWNERRPFPTSQMLDEIANGLGENFTTKAICSATSDLYGESPAPHILGRMLRSTGRWVQAPSGRWLKVPLPSP